MESDKSFGQSLKHYRQARYLTQANLAERVNCATESIRKIEANRQRPSQHLAARLADILAIPQEERAEFLDLARAHTPSSTPAYVVNLPAQMTTLVRREQDLATITKLLRNPDVHLVTLTGPGGVGKTRLAAQLAIELLHDFSDGVYFVPLDRVPDASLVASAIAQVLHIRAASSQFISRFGSFLRQKHILLVLDNFEHVMAATPLIAELFGSVPTLHILITSRTTLNLYGEHEFKVQPLAIPDLKALPSSTQLALCDSVRIFVERTRAVKADFVLTESNAAAVAEICCRLDGLPLALELAAAYGKMLSPLMLLEHLKKEPINLSATVSNLPERHSTLRNTIQWSYQLLNPVEQSIFQQLSVFLGGCTLEAVEQVCALPGESVLPYLRSLLDKSLLQQTDAGFGEARYIMLDTIRAYAFEQLHLAKQEDAVGERHLAYYLKMAEEIAPKLLSAEQWKWLEHLEREIGNLRMAIQWAVHHHAGEAVVRLCSNLQYFWYEFGHPAEIYTWIEAVLTHEMDLPTDMKATALRFTGYVLMTMQSNYLQARMFFEDSLQLWQQLDNQPEIADTLAELGAVTMELGDYNRSQTLHEECLKIRDLLGDANGVQTARERLGIVMMRQGKLQEARGVFEACLSWWRQQNDLIAEAFALTCLGAVAMYQESYDPARVYLEQALALWQALGDKHGISSALNALGPVALHQGNPVEANTFLIESLSIRWENQDYDGIAWNLERLGEVAFTQEHLERGAQLWGAAESLREKYHNPLFPAERQRYEPVLKTARLQLGEAAWSAFSAKGRAKPIEEIVNDSLLSPKP